MINLEKTYKNLCTVNLDNLVHNYRHTVEISGKKVICVIKADAYGHGAVRCAKELEKAGCDMFAVSSCDEALQLKEGGIVTSDILILGRILPFELESAIEHGFILAAGSEGFIQSIIELKCKAKARLHIKLNTGMNRTGFDTIHGGEYPELTRVLTLIKANKELIDVEGVFSHFARAEDSADFTNIQFDNFNRAVAFMEKNGITPKIKHICNSAGTVGYRNMNLDAVRLGIYLYGCESSDSSYLPVMSLQSTVLEIHRLHKGDGVSYGLDFVCDKDMTIAVIGIGYADGLHRCLSNGKGYFLYKSVKCPIVGRICMDMTMIDISAVENPSVFDRVTVFGDGESGFISCQEQAENAGTISYELLCSVSKRVSRVYTGN